MDLVPPAGWRCCNKDRLHNHLTCGNITKPPTRCLCTTCVWVRLQHYTRWWEQHPGRTTHTKKTQASRSCDNTVVSPAGTVHLPTTGPLWTVSIMSSRWAVALQPGTKPRSDSRRCICSSLNPGMAFPLKQAVIFSYSHSSKSTTRAATIHPPLILILIHTAAAERFWAAPLGPRCRVSDWAGPEENSPAFSGDVAAGWESAPPLPYSPPSSM